MKRYLALSLILSFLATAAQAQMRDEECDPEVEDCVEDRQIKEPVKTIYPYKPFETSEVKSRLVRITENTNFLWNIREMERRGLNRANTTIQPWGSSFWPLFQGMVANTYQDKDSEIFITTLQQNLFWKKNLSDFKKRKEKVLPKVMEMSEEELAKLAPSEKYDLLLGDTNFGLTNIVWDYVENWGRHKKWGFLAGINLPDDYRIPKANDRMAFWEGICHGWALGSGLTPRPEKPVTITLPNGKQMPFYSSDIKALASLMWANNDIQDYVILEGNRCNKRFPDQDKFGRYIDVKKDPNDTELQPRCGDVHPAVFHVALINILGLEGRSFVLDHNPKSPIANQPVSGYELTYFNPRTGKDGTLSNAMISVADYGKKDPYRENRNPETAFIVGVDMNIKYIDWELPKKQVTSSPKDDKIEEYKFKYDLEIDAGGRVIGGQWRVTRKGGPKLFGGSTNQPDYFWVAPRDWKKFFKPAAGLPQWNETQLPSREYVEASISYEWHNYVRFENHQCPVFPINGNGLMDKVDCQFKFPRPRPLTNVVERLIELSNK